MFIIHCLTERAWNDCKNKAYYGEESLCKYGFIHCSEISTYRLVAPNFKEVIENLVLIVIDTDRLENEVQVRWEDLNDCGIMFPHVYGLLNISAVVETVPHLWNEHREWVVNNELLKYCD